MFVNREQWRFVFDAVSTVALLATCATLLWKLNVPPDGVVAAGGANLPVETIEVARATSNKAAGDSSAQVVLLAFLDFQCPFCAKFGADTYPALKRDYIDKGLLRYEFHHFPLDSIHPNARRLGAAVECAGAQGKYWAMHDSLIGAGPRTSGEDLRANAAKMQLDEVKFSQCLESDVSLIDADVKDGAALGVSSTPTFFIGRVKDGRMTLVRRIQGAMPYAAIKSVIEDVRTGRAGHS